VGLQLFYSLSLKHIAIVDILTLATGYIIRVFAGELITGYHISVWLLLTTVSLALFLAVGKRRRELTLIAQYSTAQIRCGSKIAFALFRKTADMYAAIFATTAFITYSLFTFLRQFTNQ